ncbi:hypothetical protein RvY_16694-2 [Ramazzottius varieornatus]|uniref:FERM domain-containing protein n=1 Tax=Ramazzottius varieornatus TaxID=947166 RepID=A0A1D1W044_RAMVA|nr:hypothetical protein RvY_16694-2 [Ramazzottius varieornatus]
MVQETVAYRTETVVRGTDSPSLDGDNGGLSEKDLKRMEKERREDEKRMKKEREKAEKNALKEHERLQKLAREKEKEEARKSKKNGVSHRHDSPAMPVAYSEDDVDESMDRSPPVSPVAGKTSTIPSTYEHVTEEISAQAAGPGHYATNTMKNFSVNTNGRTKDVVVPVIPADRTATPNGQASKSGSTTKATVRLLSDQDAEFQIPKSATGQYLFDRVCEFINLQERDYFGIRYMDSDNERSWLNMEKTVKQQMKNGPWNFEFLVKFYPPQPTELKEDLTRYYLCMQIHRDLITEKLPASFTTYAILGSLMVQSELGDYDRSRHIGNYVSEVPLAPPNKQNAELEEKVMELHKETTRGMPPTEADLRYLESAKRLAFYGVDLHKAKDSENSDIKVGVSASGVQVYRENLRVNRFAWPKVLKISYRRNNFYIKIRPLEAETSEKEICFRCPYQKAAKRLWKVCVEHHTFFRTRSSEEPSDYSTLRWPRLGSRFRYSGRTYSEAKASSERLDRPPPDFNRTWSKRNPYSVSVDGLSAVGRGDGDDRPSSVSGYDRRTSGGVNNVYDRPVIGRGVPGGERVGWAEGQGLGGTVYQTQYVSRGSKYPGDNDGGESPTEDSSLLTNHTTTQETSRYTRQDYYVDPNDPTKLATKIPTGGVGVMTTTYGNVTQYTSRTKTTTSTIKSSIEQYPGGYLPTDSTTLTTRSIDGPTMTSSEGGIPLGSPTRKTETHSLGPNGPTVVSSKVQTIETTTIEMDRNGEKEKHIEEKVTILVDGEDLDHDKALRDAIQAATNLNPNFEVEKLEIDHEESDH